MSFKVPYTDVSICNRALSRLKESPIAAIDQGGVAARECRQWYKPTVRWLLEEFHWNLATVRTALAEKANTRSTEWNYAYAAPADLAFPVQISPYGDGANIGYYAGLKQFNFIQRMAYVGDTIYSSVAGAYLDYTSLDINESQFNELFVSVIELYLASRMAIGVRGSEKMRDAYEQQGLTALQNAKARNLNANGPTYGDTMSEADRVRTGGSEYLGGNPFPGGRFFQWPVV